MPLCACFQRNLRKNTVQHVILEKIIVVDGVLEPQTGRAGMNPALHLSLLKAFTSPLEAR
jgi:hypothetical protein